MLIDKKNGYYNRKYYIDGKEIPLSDDIKEIFEETRKLEHRIIRQERRYKVGRPFNYVVKTNGKVNFDSGIDIEDIPDNSQNVEEMVSKDEEILKIRKALGELEKDELELIRLLIDKELTEREISNIMGISQVSVNKRKHKVFGKLRNLLKDLIISIL
ncbi:sigma-70 family RNA polymerase sigma factor [Criibacterium bergeronii]|uniref:Sigma-70 family RNA polymerase sigma factor n=1 Tax=Criibacterium bergeronii TaxID=1871336 RepID=A0A552UV73_9FIRM|nr:sigma-70 family RNA polymerase sigma factor [Criibacterium bergeronii]TRW22097.1 sigma-70 family RNA polymerase sigma factor [Criibacterium bergeronii]